MKRRKWKPGMRVAFVSPANGEKMTGLLVRNTGDGLWKIDPDGLRKEMGLPAHAHQDTFKELK